MDDEDRKRLVAFFVSGALTLTAAYLLKDELFSILEELREKEEKGEEVKKKEVTRISKGKIEEKVTEEVSKVSSYASPWSGMTWEKLERILGRRYTGRNFVEAYYALSDEEKMMWRKALREDSLTLLDKQFVYLDSQIILRHYRLRYLSYALSRYTTGRIPFEELFRAYKKALADIYAIE